ncbi:MAG: TolC family outer membrane protein [Alphaproteobacteria bacterium]|nr:TolC family outer membrane protein [Alphaproteobacteria bacterium]
MTVVLARLLRLHRTGASAIALGVALGLSSWSAPAHAQSIVDALALSYMTNPQIDAQRAKLRATDEGVPAAIGGWLPKVTVSGGYGKGWLRIDSPNRVSEQQDPRSATFTFDQTFWRGGGQEADLDKAEAQVRQERASLDGVERTVLLSAATAYMNVLRNQAVVELRRNNVQVLERQLEATRDRFNVGENTRTDVAQAEARLASARAQLRAAEGDLSTSRATYQQVVGEQPGVLVDPSPPASLPLTLDEAVEAAKSSNPDVRVAIESEKVAETDVDRSRALLLPTLSFQAQLQRSEETGRDDVRQTTGIVQGRVSVPIYQGGGEYAGVRTTKETVGQRRLELDNARRRAIESAVQAWELLRSAEAQIESFDVNVRATEVALDGVQQEAAVGARTVLDVLDAEQEALNAKVNLVGARRDRIIAAYQLLAATGRLTAVEQKLPVTAYDPKAHYDRTRWRLIGTGIESK